MVDPGSQGSQEAQAARSGGSETPARSQEEEYRARLDVQETPGDSKSGASALASHLEAARSQGVDHLVQSDVLYAGEV